MNNDLIDILQTLGFTCIPTIILAIWVLTFIAYKRRLKEAGGNSTLAFSETIKYATAPLTSFTVGLFELLYSLFRRFTIVFIILFIPIWVPLLILFLLWLVLPEILDRMFRNLGVWGEAIMRSIEGFPQRTQQRFRESRAQLVGDLMIFLTNSPLSRIITSRKAIQGLEVIGFQTKAVSILKSAALDSSKGMGVRLNAVRSLGRMDLKDDLIDIVRYHNISPEVARDITAWLMENRHIPEYLQAWRLLARHNLPAMRLEAARKLNLEGYPPEARRVFLSLMQGSGIPETFRIQAIEELGYMDYEANSSLGLKQIASTGQKAELKLAAMEALARIEDAEHYVAEICKFLDTRQPNQVRKEAIQVLSRLNRRDELVSICKNQGQGPEERFEACLALEKSGFDLHAFICLWNLSLEKSLTTGGRLKAIQELGDFGEGWFNQNDFASFQRRRSVLVSQAENEENPAILRLGIARTLEKLGCESDAGTLYILLANAKPIEKPIRNQAVRALKALRARQA